ncbi:hypothetical protein IT408_04425 [Candidatus Uhrbacteria bacterium]|nr:hypothetical protein [Candidatus Uhrbacteria bacterium]
MDTLPNQTPTTPKKNPTQYSRVIMALIALIALVTLGATILYVLRRPNQPTMPAVSDIKPEAKVSKTIVPPLAENKIDNEKATPEPSTVTTTASITTPNKENDANITLGETFQIFKGDAINISLPNQTHPRWNIKAISFSDSRCPVGVQCIWAGEQTVTLLITDLVARVAPQDITLGTTRNTNQSVYGINLTVKTIEDGKGGTYAEIETK